jgi:hypothetical protein
VKVPPVRLLLVLLVTHMTLQHQRHQQVLVVVAALVLARPLAEALGQQSLAQARRGAAAGFFVLAALALTLLRFAVPARLEDGLNRPVTALGHVPPQLLGRPVFNSYGLGGLLIFRGVRPIIDGRADMYGDDYFGWHLRVAGGDRAAAEAAIARHRIDWTLLAPREPLVQVMDTMPGWTRVYGDRYGVVHVRTAALSAPAVR